MMAELLRAALAAEHARNGCEQSVDNNRELGEGKVRFLPEPQHGHVGDLLGIGHGEL